MNLKVAVIKTSPQTIIEDYSKLLYLIESNKILSKSKDLLLKLNLSWSLYYPACSTEPWQLEGVIRFLQKEGYDFAKIFPVENETVVTNVWKGVKLNKWLSILKNSKLKFTALPEVKWIKYSTKSEMLAMDKIFPEGLYIPEMFIGNNMIHLPTMKTHGHTTMTGAMKNAFGGLITRKRHHCHKMIHEVLVDLLSIQKEIHPKIIAVMDGTVCGDGAGPRTMNPVIKNYILASSDQVAIDAVSAKMMGFDPFSIKFIKLAHDRGLGNGDLDQIEILGENISNVNFGFKTKTSPIIKYDKLFRKGALSFIEPVLFHTKLFHSCIKASATYHDKIWYPLIGKKNINNFMKTDWGRLFKQY